MRFSIGSLCWCRGICQDRYSTRAIVVEIKADLLRVQLENGEFKWVSEEFLMPRAY